jgi:hypothetical protein
MRITENTPFRDFLIVAKNNHAVRFSNLGDINPVNPKVDIMQMPFETFAIAVKYATSIETAIDLMFIITKKNYSKISTSLAYSHYLYIQNEIKRILEMFNDIDSELPTPKKIAKSLEEFGFRNIISFLANNDVLKYDEYYKKTVGFIYLAYRERVYKHLNEIAQHDIKSDN